jgi:hypothetical protein
MSSTTAAGTTIDISAGYPSMQSTYGYSSLAYVNIGGVESIGAIGANTAKTDFQPLAGPKQKHKGSTDYGSLQPNIAVDSGDAGQALLRAAADPANAALYAFRVTYPDGAKRFFQARAFGFPETIGNADAMVIVAPTIEINTPIVKVAADGGGATVNVMAMLTLGQSNAERMQINAQAEMQTGLASFLGDEWVFLDAAADGSSVFQRGATDSNWWINDDDTMGPRWQEALAAVAAAKASGATVTAFYFNQGEGDSGAVSASQAASDAWGAAWLRVFASVRGAAGGNPRIFMVPMNRRGDGVGSNARQVGYTYLRRKIVQLAAENPTFITLMPEMFDQVDDGGPHTLATGYKALAPRMYRKIAKTRGAVVAGGVDGPRITAVARDGATITATITHDGGTDITPAAGIQGFVYLIDGVPQVMGAGTRIDATHVQWTLSQNQIQGVVETGAYARGSMPDITDYTKILRDNQAVPLPCRFAEVVATVTNAAPPQPGPAPSIYVADPIVATGNGFDLRQPTQVSLGGGKVRVRQNAKTVWTARIKGQEEINTGIETKQLKAGRTYRLTVTRTAPADGTPGSGTTSFVIDPAVTLLSGGKVNGANILTTPGTLVTTITPAVDCFVGLADRGNDPGNMDLDDFMIEDITP